MRPGFFRPFFLATAATLALATPANAGFLTFSHNSTALPGAPGPAITLSSITGNNDGTNLTFTLTFFNATIEGPSSGKNDAVFGFINIDADKNAATGASGASLDSGGVEPGFGRYPPGFQGIDVLINLGSEGDPTHGAPGLLDVVTTKGFTPLTTVAVTYKNQSGSTPSTMSLSIPLTLFSSNNIALNDTGNFSVVVGNLNNATDFLPSAAVPEPGSVVLLGVGVGLTLVAFVRSRRRAGARRTAG
jgi:hypothetical protein